MEAPSESERPRLTTSAKERATRRAAREAIFAKHEGGTDEALREYGEYLQDRMEREPAGPAGETT